MATKSIEIFKQMLDWVYANTVVYNQADVARITGLNEVTISRILKGRIRGVKQETLRKVNTAFGNVFNPEWLRGESDIMLLADCPQKNTTVPVNPDKETFTDMTSLINASLAAKDETIMALKREGAAKDETIAALHELIADRAAFMHSIRQQADDISKKFDELLQVHNALLHRMNTDSYNIADRHISIATEDSNASDVK